MRASGRGDEALEWIIDRYKVTKDKESGIVNDPNEWSDDPRYIVDLIKKVTRVSVETVRIVGALPSLEDVALQDGGRGEGVREVKSRA